MRPLAPRRNNEAKRVSKSFPENGADVVPDAMASESEPAITRSFFSNGARNTQPLARASFRRNWIRGEYGSSGIESLRSSAATAHGERRGVARQVSTHCSTGAGKWRWALEAVITNRSLESASIVAGLRIGRSSMEENGKAEARGVGQSFNCRNNLMTISVAQRAAERVS